MEYRITLAPDSNGTVLVTFPDFPEAATFGDTEEEALRRALDALETVIDAYMKDRRPIPRAVDTPAKSKGPRRWVRVPALVAAKIDLYEALRASNITKYALAKKLGWHVPQVDRLFNLKHQSHLAQIEEAAEALGKHLEVRVS